MKRNKFIFLFSLIFVLFSGLAIVDAQTKPESFTGNIISFNGPRVRSGNFNLRINGQTPDNEANALRDMLESNGQDSVLSAIQKNNLGSFSINNGLSRNLNFIRETEEDGKTKIFVVFERWLQFAEVRNGYRSMDYPFSVLELVVDPKTGKGEGTFIAAARIRWVNDSKKGTQYVEIENFATYPAKLVNVKMSNK